MRRSLLALLVAADAAHAVSPAAFVSSNDGSKKLSSTTAPIQGNGDANGASTWKISIDDTQSGYQQQISGFGAAITDATASTFNVLSASDRQSLLNQIFSPSGANFNLLRHTIGSSDLSASVYTYDDFASGDLRNQSRLGSQGNSMLALLRSIKTVQSGMVLLGSVWSLPGSLKLNGKTSGQTLNNNLDLSKGSTIAQYFVQYIKTFRRAGVPVQAITLQNEPLNSQAGYPTCYVSADDAVSVIKNNLGPDLKSANLSTQIWAYDHNTDHPEYPQQVLESAGEYVNSVAWHCYADNNKWSALTDFHNKNPKVPQYMTECWTSPQTSWDHVLDFTSGPLQNWASGVIAWTLGSDTAYSPHLMSGGCSTCRGLITIDTHARTYTLNKDFYFLAQYSKFIPRAATMLSTTGSYDYGGGQRIEAVASVNPDGSRTVVIWNGFNNAVRLSLTTKSGEAWSGPLYAQSATTWTLPPSAGGRWENATLG